MQLADAPLIDMDLLYWSRHFRNMPGEGDLPVTDFMRAVAATGYDGPLSLEIFNDQFRGGSPKSIAVDGRRSLIYLMDQVARAEPDVAIDGPDDARPRSPSTASSSSSSRPTRRRRRSWRRCLRRLGFRLAGAAQEQGRGALPAGRHQHRRQHGEGGASPIPPISCTAPSAYAIGLKVEDAAATVARARALGAEPFEQRRGPGELAIPAIRGVGGGVIYFLDEQERPRPRLGDRVRAGLTAAGDDDAGLCADRPRRADDEL